MPDTDAAKASTDPYLPDSRALLSTDPGIAFREAMRQSQLGFSFVGIDGHILSANPAMAGLTGYSPADLVGMSTELLTPDDDLPTLTAAEDALISGASSIWIRRRRIVRKDGSLFWADLTASPVRAYNGQVLGILGVIEDVSAEVIAALQQQAAESGWLSLVRDSPSSFALLDLEGGSPR